MGYTTEFTGAFLLDRPLSSEDQAFLEGLRTRRSAKDPEKIARKKKISKEEAIER